MRFKGQANFIYLLAAFSFFALYRTNRLSNRYMLGLGLIRREGILTICSSRMGVFDRRVLGLSSKVEASTLSVTAVLFNANSDLNRWDQGFRAKQNKMGDVKLKT